MAIGKSDNDVHHRREIIQPDDCMAYEAASNGQTACKSLYRSAPSFEAYSDTSTLKSWLQQLKMEIGKRTQLAIDGSVDGDNNGGVGGSSSSDGRNVQP